MSGEQSSTPAPVDTGPLRSVLQGKIAERGNGLLGVKTPEGRNPSFHLTPEGKLAGQEVHRTVSENLPDFQTVVGDVRQEISGELRQKKREIVASYSDELKVQGTSRRKTDKEAFKKEVVARYLADPKVQQLQTERRLLASILQKQRSEETRALRESIKAQITPEQVQAFQAQKIAEGGKPVSVALAKNALTQMGMKEWRQAREDAEQKKNAQESVNMELNASAGATPDVIGVNNVDGFTADNTETVAERAAVISLGLQKGIESAKKRIHEVWKGVQSANQRVAFESSQVVKGVTRALGNVKDNPVRTAILALALAGVMLSTSGRSPVESPGEGEQQGRIETPVSIAVAEGLSTLVRENQTAGEAQMGAHQVEEEAPAIEAGGIIKPKEEDQRVESMVKGLADCMEIKAAKNVRNVEDEEPVTSSKEMVRVINYTRPGCERIAAFAVLDERTAAQTASVTTDKIPKSLQVDNATWVTGVLENGFAASRQIGPTCWLTGMTMIINNKLTEQGYTPYSVDALGNLSSAVGKPEFSDGTVSFNKIDELNIRNIDEVSTLAERFGMKLTQTPLDMNIMTNGSDLEGSSHLISVLKSRMDKGEIPMMYTQVMIPGEDGHITDHTMIVVGVIEGKNGEGGEIIMAEPNRGLANWGERSSVKLSHVQGSDFLVSMSFKNPEDARINMASIRNVGIAGDSTVGSFTTVDSIGWGTPTEITKATQSLLISSGTGSKITYNLSEKENDALNKSRARVAEFSQR